MAQMLYHNSKMMPDPLSLVDLGITAGTTVTITAQPAQPAA